MPESAGGAPPRRTLRYQLDTGLVRLTSDRAIADFASAYADQNERDYEALADAAKSGRITAERGL